MDVEWVEGHAGMCLGSLRSLAEGVGHPWGYRFFFSVETKIDARAAWAGVNARDEPRLAGDVADASREKRRLQHPRVRAPAQDPSVDFLQPSERHGQFNLAVREPPDLLRRMPVPLPDQARGESGECHPDFVAHLADAPPLDAAHLGIEVPLERILQRQEFLEMAPAQLSRQCSDNLRFGENFRELHHPGEILRVIAGAELCRQLSRQRGDNLRAVFRTALAEDVRPNPVANLPAVKHQPGIHRAGDLLTRGKDQPPHIRKQGAGLCLVAAGFFGMASML
jgi:hypothetical protein